MRILQANAQVVRRFDSTQRGRVSTVQSFANGEWMCNHMRGFYMEEIKHTDDGIYIKRVDQAERRATVGMNPPKF
jgi:hypothetical protein